MCEKKDEAISSGTRTELERRDTLQCRILERVSEPVRCYNEEGPRECRYIFEFEKR